MSINDLISFVDDGGKQPTGGKWLEDATLRASTQIRDWDIAECFSWADWPDRATYFPASSGADVGIDLVARRASYAEYIAIQCKARLLDANGEGKPISKPELDSFASVSANHAFAERWVVTNGNVAFGGNAEAAFNTDDRPLKLLNLAHELQEQAATQRAEMLAVEACDHCATGSGSAPPPVFGRKTRFVALTATTDEIMHAARGGSRKRTHTAGARAV